MLVLAKVDQNRVMSLNVHRDKLKKNYIIDLLGKSSTPLKTNT